MIKLTEAGETISVNYALSMARLPVHFYSLMKNLTGRDALYQNPGISLRAFIVAKWIDHELFELDGEMLETLRECEVFSTDPETIPKIIIMLNSMFGRLIDEAAALDAQSQISVQKKIEAVNEKIERLNKYSMSDMIQDEEMKQTLFSSYEEILDAAFMIQKLSKTKA